MSGSRTFLNAGSQYALFLNNGPSAGSYNILGGTNGRFLADGGAVIKFCIDYSAPSDVPARGKNQGESWTCSSHKVKEAEASRPTGS